MIGSVGERRASGVDLHPRLVAPSWIGSYTCLSAMPWTVYVRQLIERLLQQSEWELARRV